MSHFFTQLPAKSTTMKKPKTKRKPKNLILSPSNDEASTPSTFSFALTRTAVAQICGSAGFRGAQLSALQTLARIAALYLQTLASSAASFANSANRSQSNLLDIVNALHDLTSAAGFPGASGLHCSDASLLSSNVLADLSRFVKFRDEIPFAKPIPRVAAPPPSTAVAGGGNGSGRGAHVPEWLPDYPTARMEKSCLKVERCKMWEETVMDLEVEFVENVRPPERRSREELPAERERVSFKVKGEKKKKRVCCFIVEKKNILDR